MVWDFREANKHSPTTMEARVGTNSPFLLLSARNGPIPEFQYRGETMDILPTEEEDMVRNLAREFLEGECPTTLVRAMEKDDQGYPP